MSEIKNLVQDYLLEQKIIDSNSLSYSFYYDEITWYAYKEKSNTMFYVSYELTEYGIGYAFCVRITCEKLTYNIDPIFYSKSFSDDTNGEWKNISDSLKDKLLSNAISDLRIYG